VIATGRSALSIPLPFVRADIEQTIPSRFEQVAGRSPDHLALTGNGRRWTYRELDRQTNRIARAIAERTRPGAGCVAYLLDHSPETAVATLAVLKAGKTYLALHPGVPVAAQIATVRDAGPQLVVTTAELEPSAREVAAGVSDVLALESVDAGLSDEPLPATTYPHDPSTIFYTSGTTGRPKGVVKSHRAVLHRVWLATEHDAVAPADRQSLLTHCSFSASEADMFGALLLGATLCTFDIASRGLTAFRSWLEDERVTLLHPPVLLFRRFLATLRGADLFPSVRLVALAGDTVRPSDVERWRRHFSRSCVLLHRFSTTETALLAVARIDAGSAGRTDLVEGGRPVADKELVLVDEAGQPVADGAVGELIVRSAYLADGYWGRPEATAAAFSPDSASPGRRTYRTGDFGRFMPDGRFVFLGRRDHQVKIRGYRVDIGETESALLGLDEVAEGAVVAREEAGEPCLVAFAVPQDGAPFDQSMLRARLAARLPEWKLPARVYECSSLPTTLTGKVDRQRLARDARARVRPAEPAPVGPARSGPPAGQVEREVSAIFAGLLRRPAVDRAISFFDLGGHSLLLLELQLALEAAFNRTVPIDELLRDPTVAGVAAAVERRPPEPNRWCPSSQRLVPLHQAGAGRALFIVHGGLGRATTSPRFLAALGSGHPVYGFQAKGFADAGARISDMAADYVAAMRGVQPEGPYWLAASCAGGSIALEMACQLQAIGQGIGPMLLIDPALPPREQHVLRFLAKRAALSLSTRLIGRRFARRYLERYIHGDALPEEQVRDWLHFRVAAYRHRPAGYDGPVHVIGSRARLEHFRAGRWARCLTGDVQLHEVGRGHRDVFDPANEQSVLRLRQYAVLARAWFAACDRPQPAVARPECPGA